MLTPEQIAQILTDPSLREFSFGEAADLGGVLAALKGGTSDSGAWRRKRGYGLERIVHEALLREGIPGRPATPPKRGDQLDGALMLEGRAVIYECKWERKPVSSTTLTQFQAKVDRRLVGTVGFVISASGYADESHNYLERGHPINTMLVDLEDLEWALLAGGSMAEMLRSKIQRAAWDGITYWRDPAIREAIAAAREGGLIVVTQGPRDEWLLNLFVQAMGEVLNRSFQVPVLAAYGVYQTNALAAAIASEAPSGTSVVAVIDGDGTPVEEVERIWHEDSPNIDVIVADPTIESWFEGDNGISTPAARQLYSRVFAGDPDARFDTELLRRLQREHSR